MPAGLDLVKVQNAKQSDGLVKKLGPKVGWTVEQSRQLHVARAGYNVAMLIASSNGSWWEVLFAGKTHSK